MNSQPFDLNSILNVQKAYLTLPNVDTNGNLLADLQGNLNSLYTSYQSANPAIQSTLNHQKEVLNILNNEQTRLNYKQSVVDDALNGKIRASQLNESYRKRRAAYMKIMIIISVTIIAYLLVSYLPIGIQNLMMIIVLCISGYYIMLTVSEIYIRDSINYDTLNIPPPKTMSSKEILEKQLAAAKSGDLLGTIINPDQCVGPECCDKITSRWSADLNKCVPICKDGKIYDSTTAQCVDKCSDGKVLCDTNICLPAGSACKIKVETFDNNHLGSILPYTPQSDNLNYSTV